MKILSVHIRNYGAFHGEHVFPLLDRGLTLLIGDNQDEPLMNNNGAGKSTVFDALDWCLFGVIPRGDHVDSIINEEAAHDCEVTVFLEDDDGRPASVRRYRAAREGKANGVELLIDGQNHTALDDRETQVLINTFLGLDREIFHAIVLFGQQDLFHFADATNAQQMGVLTKVLQLEDVDDWLERAKAKVKVAEKEVHNAHSGLAVRQGELQALEAQNFDAQEGQWENERAERVRAGIQQLNDFQVNVDKAQTVLVYEEKVREVYAQHSAHRELGLVYDWSDFDLRIGGARAAERAVNEKFALTLAKGQQLRDRHDAILGKTEGDCSECGQPVTRVHLEQEASKLQPELDKARILYGEQEAELGRARAAVQQAEARKEEQRQLHAQGDQENERNFREAQKQLKDVEEAKAYIAQASKHMAHLRATMEQARVAPNPFEQKRQELLQQKHVVSDKIVEHKAVIDHAQDQLHYFEFWVKAFGPQGLKSYVLDSRLQEMTDAANQWVKLLTGGTIWVRFETQTKGRSTGKLSNKITIRVFRYNPSGSIRERNYQSWSGGEKRRVAWAIDFGLSRLIAARATKRYDLLILDEVFKHVDRAGGEAVVEMLRALRHEKSSIFVIEQDEQFQSQFENVVLVRKHNERSQILEVTRVEEEKAPTAVGPKPKAKPKRKARRSHVPSRAPVEGERP